MVGRTRKKDVKSRLGRRNLTTTKPKTGRIRDARDVLKQKGSAKVNLRGLPVVFVVQVCVVSQQLYTQVYIHVVLYMVCTALTCLQFSVMLYMDMKFARTLF